MMICITALLLFSFLMAVTGDEHSLLYLYSMRFKHSNKVFDCTAVTLLENREIDFYNSSSDESRNPTHKWLKKISDPDWKTRTEKLDYDRQFLNKLIDMQMDESGNNRSGDHVLQWRHGCEGERSSDGSVTLLNSIYEFGYDGEDLIHFNCTSEIWLTPEKKKNREREEKWSKLYRYTGIRKCEQCEEMLKMYLKYSITDITPSNTPPAVRVIENKSLHDSSELTLICLATGFYPKDVEMRVRKSTTSIPEHLVASSGVRPNDDGTYQLRKSVEIPEDDKAQYSCYVSHRTLKEPITVQWEDGRCTNCSRNRFLGSMLGVGLPVSVVILIIVVICVLKKRGRNDQSQPANRESVKYTQTSQTETEASTANGFRAVCNGNAVASTENTSHNQTEPSL